MCYVPSKPKAARFPDLDPRRVIAEGEDAAGHYLEVEGWSDPLSFAWHGDLLWKPDEVVVRRRWIGPSWFRVRAWQIPATVYRPASRPGD